MRTNTRSLENIKQVLSATLEILKSKYHITYVGIFGSYARNEQKPSSDIDILVDFDPEFYPGYLDFLLLKYDLEDMLEVEVDLITKSSLRKRIGKHILEEAIAL